MKKSLRPSASALPVEAKHRFIRLEDPAIGASPLLLNLSLSFNPDETSLSFLFNRGSFHGGESLANLIFF